MASKFQTLMLFFTSIIIASSVVSFSALPSHHHVKKGLPLTSTISASPSYFPSSSPLSSPSPSSSVAMPPDVTPLLPTPAPDSTAFSPSDSSIPTIPSSPSPPDPESIFPPQPLMAASPTGSMPDSSSVDLNLSPSFFLGLLALWLFQI